MPVSNEHLNNLCQVWDGLTYDMIPVKEAAKLEKQGLVQRTANLQASDLKTAADFDVARQKIANKEIKAELPPGVQPQATKKKRTYKTRQMKADGDS